MIHTYQISGMTCSGCQAKVQSLLSQIKGVKNVDISLAEGTADITMEQHIPTDVLQKALEAYPKYQLTEAHTFPATSIMDDTDNRTWLQTYRPILLIFAYILGITLIAGHQSNGFSPMVMMRVFMSGFFLTFSFFKMLDLQGFADSYAMYDIIARRIKAWGYIYAFVELVLGLAYAFNLLPKITSAIAFLVMTVSLAGVLQSVLNKQKIRCACLGAVFNLPMSTVTIIEDGLMIVMSLLMFILY
ncbi:MAG: MauE/DoxX family redox-associated membrane protein [Mucilaginibacter sp.]|uniref:heavy-metal-associated domain-containing protein n=1 Tax=Mucilaginibacter sp. TaxID=1882438 RepID=UPI0032676363